MPALAQKTSFKISYDPDYAPFSYENNNKAEGMFIDFWRLWAQKNQYEITFVNGEYWDNAIDLVKKGEVDFFLGTNPYEDWMKSSNTFYSLQTSLFIHAENIKGFSKEASYLIGIVGEDYYEKMKSNFKNSEVVIYKDYDLLFKDFNSRKIDLIYDDKIAIEYYALKNNYFHLIRSIILLNDDPEIKAISNKQDLIDIFNYGFGNLSNEELHYMEKKWILDSTQQIYKTKVQLSTEEQTFISNRTLNISVSKDWKPFSFEDNKKPSGISWEIWQLILEKVNLDSKYTFYDSFSKQLDSIKEKKEDIIFSVGKTADREEYSIFTIPYAKFPLSIVTLKDENFIENINYLFDKKIAVGKNFTAHKILKEEYPNLNFLLVENIKEGLYAVKNSKAFAFIDIKPSLTYNIKRLALDELKISGNTGLDFELSIMIRNDYKILQSILNKAILYLDKKQIEQIIQTWSKVQFEDKFNYRNFWIASAIIFIIILILIYFNQRNIQKNKTLSYLVNERTKELKYLNEELEQKVFDKTKELRDINYLLDEAQQIAKLGSFSYDLIRKELIWSNELYKIFNHTKNEFTPTLKSFLSFIHEDDKKLVKNELFNIAKSHKRQAIEFRVVLKDENIKYLQATSKNTKYSDDGKASFIVGTVLDLTKIKTLELEKREKETILSQQSKMAAMGEMLENIAHQWRQPLSVISTAVTGMQLQHEIHNKIDENFLLENMKSINHQTQYLSKTIEDFKNFFSPNKETQLFDIKQSIEKTLFLMESRLKVESVTVIKELESIKIKTIENELTQTLLNVFNNAIDALSSRKIENKFIHIKTFVNNNSLVIEVKDNAGGIPVLLLNRVLEPYFTTKHKAQGTGIGLYMSNEIITKHLKGQFLVNNCELIIDNVSYKGAFFTISIPLEEVIL